MNKLVAIEARVKGEWDNPELEKLGPLSTLKNDVRRILDYPAEQGATNMKELAELRSMLEVDAIGEDPLIRQLDEVEVVVDNVLDALKEARIQLIDVKYRYADFRKGRKDWDNELRHYLDSTLETVEDALEGAGVENTE